MEHLFSPFHIKNLRLKNRIVMPGLASFLFEKDGSVTDKTLEHYRNRASGGLAMVIVEACAVSAEGVVSPHQARIHDDKHIKGLSRIADLIRDQGVIPAVQLHHAGRQTSKRVINQRPIAPSNLPCPAIDGEVEPMSLAEINRIIKCFGDSAERAIKAGFELIEIHGAHGYIINQFLSGFSNIREDQYGGNTINRARFAKEIIEEVRNRIGNSSFPVSFKITAQEFVQKGLMVEESIEILKLLVHSGLDVIQVSAGNDKTPEWTAQPMFMKKACLAESASKIRKSLDIPIMTVGRINDPLVADQIIKEGQADLVCMGRGILADPQLPNKAKEGRIKEIRTCIACNTCMESIFKNGRVECLVNFNLGREKEMILSPSESPKNVLIVGGGPGGLNCAWIAAKRGHNVSLYEKQPELGGQLVLGSKDSFKKEILNLILYLQNQTIKYRVKTYLNTEVTIDIITRDQPDVIILATGSKPIIPPIPGIDKDIVVTIPEIMGKAEPLTKETIIIGGGATGCEVAHYISDKGCQVTIVEQMPEIAVQLETMTRKVMIARLKENKVNIITDSKLSGIEENGAYIADLNGTTRFLKAERIVVAIGNKPDVGLLENLEKTGIPFHRIGDCLEPRSAKNAIYEGALIGKDI